MAHVADISHAIFLLGVTTPHPQMLQPTQLLCEIPFTILGPAVAAIVRL